jgi:hypothetical protein
MKMMKRMISINTKKTMHHSRELSTLLAERMRKMNLKSMKMKICSI